MIPRGLQAFLGRLGLHKPWQAATVAVLFGGALWGIVRWANAPDYVPVMAGMPLESVDQVIQRLDEINVSHRLSRGGRDVMVPAKDLAQARVALAAEGLSGEGRPGFELFDQPSWGMTDFTQRINYRRALEGELGRTIAEMRGISDARVHLTMHETSAFRRANRPAEASVVLSLSTGRSPADNVVRGITMLVAGSVDGLVSDNVTIVDDTGRLLSAAVEPGSIAGATSRQLEMRQDLERYLESKTEDLVSEVVGAGNARVRVAALINFDQVNRTVESLDADGQVVSSESTADITPTDEAQGASRSESSIAFDTPRTIENFIGGAGQVERLTVSVLLNEARDADGAAVPRTPQDVQRIEGLVRNAVGLDDARGDAITVVSTPFEPVQALPIDNPGVGIFDRIQTLYRPVVAIVGFVLMFLVALKTLKLVSQANEERRALEGTEAVGAVGPGIPGGITLTGGDQAYLDPTNRERAMRVARERPEAAARQLRAWMQEG
ncbi:MAG: flagellar M-ring protein FliF [Gemmatimonadetes bacterium]|nr:flagellar M-ring protein FliF [Gemmatimonadota bacterium]